MTETQRLIHEFQQPPWPDAAHVDEVEGRLQDLDPIASQSEIESLDEALGAVRRGAAFTLQLGDCAERFSSNAARNSLALADLACDTAARITNRSDQPGVVILRTAGQFAKPRSKAYEPVGSRRLPVFRGDIVNAPDPTPADRTPDPERMLTAYHQARQSADELRRARASEPPLWTGHEAMLLPYERGLRRASGQAPPYGTSAHLLWIGDRTRQLDSPVVAFLASVANPVGCKLGPTARPADVASLVARLRRRRRDRSIVLICRLGVAAIDTMLPALVDGLGPAADEVVWAIDPLHGNHEETPNGLRTRRLPHAIEETEAFVGILGTRGLHPGGLHLEATWDDVAECVDDMDGLPDPDRYRSLMDPRLNPRQTTRLADVYATALASEPQETASS